MKQPDIRRLRYRFGLSNILGEILYMLLTEEWVATDDLKAICSNPRVTMYRLRLLLKDVPITIQVRRDLGYWMTDEDKATVIELAKPKEVVLEPEGELENAVST